MILGLIKIENRVKIDCFKVILNDFDEMSTFILFPQPERERNQYRNRS